MRFKALRNAPSKELKDGGALNGRHRYADAMQLPSILPSERVRSALLTAYYFNVVTYGAGRRIGAVNGMLPSGLVDDSNLQSQEVWTGTTYGLAAHLLLRELPQAAWDTAFGVYNVTYEVRHLPQPLSERRVASLRWWRFRCVYFGI
ncbi:hypothetical protein CYMTET_24333 [Cymbomonas tetramitiformis]|uniref:Glycosyl-hydrolase family 116 catalytic region domain-containing protein n=1 Tax=Cymbomonas tetramitiformis TaxID=36881 RepID=A0AAE0FWJ2_9CHLO|nr:hypothetical protein CYMTET_24333 [Cymbomonas tetramitiformis]